MSKLDQPCDSVRLASESDRYKVTSVVAVGPTWRDVWAILRGRYRPLVVKRRRMTVAGMNREIKKVWSTGAVEGQFAEIPIRKAGS